LVTISALRERESRIRSLLKAVTYRITGTVTTTLIVFMVTGETTFAFAVGIIEPAAKIVIYYLHERAWQLVSRGMIHRLFLRAPRGRST
jgi:uncharacterized membrane protein